jgi:hypothetical protein
METKVTRIDCDEINCRTFFELPGIDVKDLRTIAYQIHNWESRFDESTGVIKDYCDKHNSMPTLMANPEGVLNQHYLDNELDK